MQRSGDGSLGRIGIVGVPTAIGASVPGTELGPASLRAAGITTSLRNFGLDVADLGDVTLPPVTATKPNSSAVGPLSGCVASAIGRCRVDGRLPIILGGDHSLAFATLPAAARAADAQRRPLFVLWLDAHPDFNTPATTLTGNLHGMPVAYACGLPGFATLAAPAVPLEPDHVLMFGIRSIDRDEADLMRRFGIERHDMDAIAVHGVVDVLRRFLDRVAAVDGMLHVSFDVDVLDPPIAPAVGTPVPGGLSLSQAQHVMALLHDCGRVTSIDIAELNPLRDENGRTAALVVELVARLVGGGATVSAAVVESGHSRSIAA